MTAQKRFARGPFAIFVAAIVIFRYVYSLTNEFWFPDQDVLQIYLIGLKQFTTHTWPYFGADLVYNGSQIPGALQAVLVSIGWYVAKTPEAPIVVLNLLLDLSLGFLAWYASRRMPTLSKWFIVGYLFLLPWSICYFTRIINPSYVVPGAIVFFVGIFEIYPGLRKNILPERLAFFLLGFGIFWIFQLHMSWVLLGPFTALAFYYLVRSRDVRRIAIGVSSFVVGSFVTGSLLIPTLLRFGLSSENGKSVSGMAQINLENAADLGRLISFYFAYGSFDVTRFIGAHTDERVAFLKTYWWAAPFTVIAALAGVLLLLWMLYTIVLRHKRDAELRAVSMVTLGGIVILYLSSLFSKVQVPAHGAVLFFPLVALFGMQAMEAPMGKRWVRRTVFATFASAAIMYSAIAMKNYPTISIYTHRDVIVSALQTDNYKLVGKRRYDP